MEAWHSIGTQRLRLNISTARLLEFTASHLASPGPPAQQPYPWHWFPNTPPTGEDTMSEAELEKDLLLKSTAFSWHIGKLGDSIITPHGRTSFKTRVHTEVP